MYELPRQLDKCYELKNVVRDLVLDNFSINLVHKTRDLRIKVAPVLTNGLLAIMSGGALVNTVIEDHPPFQDLSKTSYDNLLICNLKT